jgi:hypothetical protein
MIEEPMGEPAPPEKTKLPARESSRLEGALLRLGTIGELMAMLIRGGRWWMLPLVLVLVVLGILLVTIQAFEAVAPFIYVAI